MIYSVLDPANTASSSRPVRLMRFSRSLPAVRMPSDLLSVRRPWPRGIHLIPLPQMSVPGGAPPIDRFDLLPERFQPRQAWDPTVAGPILGARAYSGSSLHGVDYPLDRQLPIHQSIIPPRKLLNGAREIPSRPHPRSPGNPRVSEVGTIFDMCQRGDQGRAGMPRPLLHQLDERRNERRRKKAKEKIEEWRQACREQGKKWLVERTLPSPQLSSSSQQEKPLSRAPPPQQKLERPPPFALSSPQPEKAPRKAPDKAPDEGELEGELEGDLEGELEGEPNRTVSHEDEGFDEELALYVAKSRTSTPPEDEHQACQQGSLQHGDRHGDDAQKPIATNQKAPPLPPPPPPPRGLPSPHFLEGYLEGAPCELMQLQMQLGTPTALVPPEDHWELMQLCIPTGAEEQAEPEDDEWEIMLQLCIQAAPEDPWEIMQLCIQVAPEDQRESMQLCIPAARSKVNLINSYTSCSTPSPLSSWLPSSSWLFSSSEEEACALEHGGGCGGEEEEDCVVREREVLMVRDGQQEVSLRGECALGSEHWEMRLCILTLTC